MAAETMPLGDSGDRHAIGDPECAECWGLYPTQCPHCRVGLMHASFGDENYDGDYWLYTRCDKCEEAA